ncbi:vomeronasal type-1 receptor 4-like [Sarcophilus harrisii]|uniref:vomeronasal type-1 receptor 4-like n=1 Tax=Sarcophilus harrisii TaxID=9305 RepID=UPI000273AC5D|nr:vomeronasal type-1 receptor 4-like [Sarcophilus harrisii]
MVSIPRVLPPETIIRGRSQYRLPQPSVGSVLQLSGKNLGTPGSTQHGSVRNEMSRNLLRTPTGGNETSSLVNQLALRTVLFQSVREFYLDLVPGIIVFMQTGAGLLGNFLLLCYGTFTFITASRMRPIDSILFHLALSNFIGIISKGIPQTMVGLGFKNFLDRVSCRFMVFLHRVAHSFSVTNTCLLSGFQIITISPFTCSMWSKLKTYASIYISPFCIFCWIVHMMIHIYMFVNMQYIIKRNNNTRIWNLGFCSDSASVSFNNSLFIIAYSIPDFLCVGFMITTSSYLVFFLQRHHQQVQHIHSSSQLSERSPEIRATYTILVLVSTYVFFYLVSSLFAFYLFHCDKCYQWLTVTTAFLDACYPTISPFVLIRSDSQILHFFYLLWQNKRFQNSFP